MRHRYRYRTPSVRGHLRALPTRGVFCVAAAEEKGAIVRDGFRPLICYNVFQEALEDLNVPDSQGINSRGNARDVTCRGTRITGTDRVPYVRVDGKPIYQVTVCENRTRKPVWLGGQWTDVEDALDGYSFREFVGHPLYAVVIGAGLAALASRLASR